MTEWSRPAGRPSTVPPPIGGPAGSGSTVVVPPPAEVGRDRARRKAAPPAAQRGPRRARLAVKHVDPWSVLKFTFVYSLALLIVLVIAVAMLYLVLDTMGVFDSVQATIKELTSSGDSGGITGIFSFRRIVGGAAFLGAINVIVITALATLGAWVYNLCADIAGGIEVTLTERN